MRSLKLTLVSVIFFLIGCQKENNKAIEEMQEISLEKARAYFENQEVQRKANVISLELHPKWGSFTQGVNDKGESYAYVDALVNNVKSKLFFTRKEEGIRYEILYPHLYENQSRLLVLDEEGVLQEIRWIPNNDDREKKTSRHKKDHGVCLWCNYEVLLVSEWSHNKQKYVYSWPSTCLGGVCSFCCLVWEGVEVSGEKKQSFGPGILPNRYENSNNNNSENINSYIDNYMQNGNNVTYPNYYRIHTSDSPYKRDSIYDKIDIKYSCAKSLLKQLPNLDNDIARMMRDVFEISSKFHITFKEDTSLIGSLTDGNTRVPAVRRLSNETIIEIQIGLNPDILTKSSNEYVLVTMYHGVLHAYLNVEREILGEKEFNEKFPELEEVVDFYGNKSRPKKYRLKQEESHNRFASFLPILAGAVITYNPNFSTDAAFAMARVGIVEDNSLSKKEVLLNKEQREGKGKFGTKCD